MAMNLAPVSETRTRWQRDCDRGAALGRVFKAARTLVADMEQLDRGLYRIGPGEVLALRTALAEAAMVIRRDERSAT